LVITISGIVLTVGVLAYLLVFPYPVSSNNVLAFLNCQEFWNMADFSKD